MERASAAIRAQTMDALPQVKSQWFRKQEMKGVLNAIGIARCRLSLAARVPQFHR